MRKSLLALLLISATASTQAQSSLGLQSRMTLMQERNAAWPQLMLDAPTRSVRRVAPQMQSQITGMIKLTDGSTTEQLQAEGVNVMRQRGQIAIVSMPTSEVERIAALPCVRQIQLARRVQQKMNNVRPAVGVDRIHAGEGLPQAYTGKGVVTGTVDQGIDPNHINFLDEHGKTRFGYMSRIYASSANAKGYIYENYYPREEAAYYDDAMAIEEMKSDDKTTYHGTHTLGIMSGGYRGDAITSVLGKDGKVTVENQPCPYYGIATESELVASCGDLYDSFIAYGLDDILSYAYYSGAQPKPCVINLSLGSNVASHDPNSLMNQFLDACGEEAIVCLAAGNEGNIPLALNKTFTDQDTKLQSFVCPLYEELSSSGTTYKNMRYGEFMAWSSDTTEFSLQMVVWNKKRNTAAVRIPVTTNMNGSYLVYCSSSDYQVTDDAIISSTFAKAFEGYVAVGSMLDEETGRYYVDVNLWASDNQTSNADGNYILGVIIEGKEGQRIDVYGDGQYCYFNGMDIDGWQDGSCDGTISDMACAHNIISVGSYNTSNQWASLDGQIYSYGITDYPVGEVTSFSSYGTLSDGRCLPDVCAPGMAVISSVNTYCVENSNMGYSDATLQGILNGDSRNNYWHQSAGTSMAVPVVAGSIALWLEADPTLTVDDVRDIIRQTAIKDADVAKGNPVQWGAGKFDAYEGLKLVLERKADGISAHSADGNRLLVRNTGSRQYEIYLAGARQLNITLTSVGGQVVARQQANGSEAHIDLSNLTSGIYVLRANNHSQKIIIK